MIQVKLKKLFTLILSISSVLDMAVFSKVEKSLKQFIRPSILPKEKKQAKNTTNSAIDAKTGQIEKINSIYWKN